MLTRRLVRQAAKEALKHAWHETTKPDFLIRWLLQLAVYGLILFALDLIGWVPDDLPWYVAIPTIAAMLWCCDWVAGWFLRGVPPLPADRGEYDGPRP